MFLLCASFMWLDQTPLVSRVAPIVRKEASVRDASVRHRCPGSSPESDDWMGFRGIGFERGLNASRSRVPRRSIREPCVTHGRRGEARIASRQWPRSIALAAGLRRISILEIYLFGLLVN